MCRPKQNKLRVSKITENKKEGVGIFRPLKYILDLKIVDFYVFYTVLTWCDTVPPQVSVPGAPPVREIWSTR